MDGKKDVRKNEPEKAPYEPSWKQIKFEDQVREWSKLTPNLVELALHANKIAELYQI